MKKLGLSLVVTSLVANLAFAEGAFVGVKGGIVYDFISDPTDYSNTHPSLGINFGYDFGKIRVYYEYNYHIGVEVAKGDIYGGFGTKTTEMFNDEYLIGADYYLN